MAFTNHTPTPEQQHLLDEMDLLWTLAVNAHLNHWIEESNKYFKEFGTARKKLYETGYRFPGEEVDDWF